MRPAKLLLYFALAGLLSACSTQSKPRVLSPLDVDDERLMAREAQTSIRKDYPSLHDEMIQTFVSRLGNKITSANQLESKPYNYSFVVVDVPLINAFALPAGSIYVTAKLLETVDTEAELAGILGHEIAHVTERHAARRLQEQQQAAEKSWMYGAGGALAGGIAGLTAGQILCPGTTFCSAQFVALGAAAGVGGGLLVQKYLFLRGSQSEELVADQLGFDYAVKAGFSPAHVADFYSRSNDPGLADSLNTHPPSQERNRQFEKFKLDRSGTISSPSFLAMKERLKILSPTSRSN